MTDNRAPLARNPISIAGFWLTTLAALAFLTYFVTQMLGLVRGPYAGLIGFIFLPLIFVTGLLLIPFGIWREGRRRERGKEPWRWPLIDLAQGNTRRVIGALVVLTLINLGIVTVATVGAMHYMETNRFCGQVCHQPMTPEFVAHQVAPHAGVDCVSCHVGPGAAGTVRAKLNGARQMALYLLGTYSRPIPTPVHNIPAPAGTCVSCHAIAHNAPEKTRVFREFADDEESTETASTLLMLTETMHWHARPDVNIEYIATDQSRETIPYVRVTDTSGGVTEFFAEGVTTRPAGDLRRMDCLDCHNRPAHTMSRSAEQAVDRAIAWGDVSRQLPFIRKEAVEVLKKEYPTQDAAVEAIRKRMAELYGGKHPAALVAANAGALERLYRTNVFPQMKVTWGTYKSWANHFELGGCFRCHDDGHKASSGKLIRQDCELCHKEK